MPIYEFKCGDCGTRFEELVSAGTDRLPCPKCGSAQTYRLISLVSSMGNGGSSCGTCVPTPEKCRGCHCPH